MVYGTHLFIIIIFVSFLFSDISRPLCTISAFKNKNNSFFILVKLENFRKAQDFGEVHSTILKPDTDPEHLRTPYHGIGAHYTVFNFNNIDAGTYFNSNILWHWSRYFKHFNKSRIFLIACFSPLIYMFILNLFSPVNPTFTWVLCQFWSIILYELNYQLIKLLIHRVSNYMIRLTLNTRRIFEWDTTIDNRLDKDPVQ